MNTKLDVLDDWLVDNPGIEGDYYSIISQSLAKKVENVTSHGESVVTEDGERIKLNCGLFSLIPAEAGGIKMNTYFDNIDINVIMPGHSYGFMRVEDPLHTHLLRF